MMTRAVHPSGAAVVASKRTPGPPGPPGPRTPRPYLVPVPDSLPPFDDELSPISRLRRLRRPGPAPRPTPAAPTGSAPAGSASPTGPGSATGSGALTGSARARPAATGSPAQATSVGSVDRQVPGLPPAGRTAQVFARALVEVFSGVRPHAQLRSHCAPEVFAELNAIPAGPATGRVRLLRVCEPAAGAAEVSVVYSVGSRSRALAFRIEGVERRWLITALQVG